MNVYGLSFVKYDFNNDCASRGDVFFTDEPQGVEKLVEFLSQDNMCFEFTHIEKVFIENEKKD